jgi:hypothetical protein
MSQEAREEKTKALSEGEGIARNSLLLANQTTTLLACLTDRIKEVRRRHLSSWSVCACLCLCVSWRCVLVLECVERVCRGRMVEEVCRGVCACVTARCVLDAAIPIHGAGGGPSRHVVHRHHEARWQEGSRSQGTTMLAHAVSDSAPHACQHTRTQTTRATPLNSRTNSVLTCAGAGARP